MLAPGAAEARFPRAAIEETFAAGFAAIGERHLEAAEPGELALWSLRGLAALDPDLQADAPGSTLRVTVSGRLLAQRLRGPGPGGAAGTLAWLLEAAWGASPALRRAGMDGVLQAAFDEVFNHLDPYSRYLAAGDAEAGRDRRSGQAGLGLRLTAGPRGVAVAEILPDSPARGSALRIGDLLLAVDGEPVAPGDLAGAEALLRGEPDSAARLLVGRGRARRQVVLRRDAVPPPSVRAERRGEILLLRVPAFLANTRAQVTRALRDAFDGRPPAGQPRAVLIDLRGNRGGLLLEAVGTAGAFLAGGVVARTDGRHRDARRVWEAPGEDLARNRPVVVLVDGRTASSAEIVAASLLDRGRAAVVGSATTGKGLIQVLVPLPNGAELSLSWSRILAPSGWPLQSLGVIPSLCTSLGAEGTAAGLAQLAEGRAPMGPVLERVRAARAPVLASEVAALRDACPPAEGRDADLGTATALLERGGYEAALLR